MNTAKALRVKLTRPARTRVTRITLPTGAIGQVLDYRRDKEGCSFVLDFGLKTVITLPVASPLIEIVNGAAGKGGIT
jgi:hypothetical protein